MERHITFTERPEDLRKPFRRRTAEDKESIIYKIEERINLGAFFNKVRDRFMTAWGKIPFTKFILAVMFLSLSVSAVMVASTSFVRELTAYKKAAAPIASPDFKKAVDEMIGFANACEGTAGHSIKTIVKESGKVETEMYSSCNEDRRWMPDRLKTLKPKSN